MFVQIDFATTGFKYCIYSDGKCIKTSFADRDDAASWCKLQGYSFNDRSSWDRPKDNYYYYPIINQL